jgi:hypothetical protein
MGGGPSAAGAPSGYPFFFNETGLPSGTNWSVEVNGARFHSLGFESIEVTLPAAPTPVNVTPLPGFVPAFYQRSVDPTAPDLNLTIPWHPFFLNATFKETGLPTGLTWGVTFGGNTGRTTGAMLDFEVQNGTYGFSVERPAGYESNITTGRILIQNLSRVLTIAFSPVLYDLTFEETGLPTGQAWSVQVGATTETSNSTAVSFQVPNGTLNYSILPIPGFHASIYSGALTVAGSALTVSVNWNRVDYPLEFSEEGLPNGTQWAVDVLGGPTLTTAQPSVTISLPDGTYSFALQATAGFHGSPASGKVTLDGQGQTISFQFVPSRYNLSFSEIGLPSGASWGVSIDGSDRVSTGMVLGLALGNGTWPWVLQPVQGFRGQPASGTIIVNGTSQTILIDFQMVTYPVLVKEQGLPEGRGWEITVGGNVYPSQNATLSLSLPNGTYPIEVMPVAGYQAAALPSPVVSVNGSSSVIYVVFNATYVPAGQPDLAGFGSWQSISILLFLVILALALIAFLLRRHHSRRKP